MCSSDLTLKELVPSLKNAFPDFNVIAMSSTVTKESLGETLRLGVAGFLVKPLQEEALTKVMAKIGRASCREREKTKMVAGSSKKTTL